MATSTNTYRSRQILAVATIPALVTGALLFYLALVNDRLPLEVATHWGPDGVADGFTARSSLQWQLAGLMVLVTLPLTLLALFLRGATAFTPKAVNGLPAGVAFFMGALFFLSIQPQLETTTPPDLGLWVIPVALVIGLIGGAVAAAIGGSPPAAPASAAPAPADAERLDLPEWQTGVWAGRTSSGKALLIAPVLVLVTGVIVGALTSWWVVVFTAVVILLALSMSSFDVTAGPTGVRVSGLLGFPRITVPLAEIAEASSENVRAMSFGGWGWRIKKGQTAVLTRSGPALTVTRTDGAKLHVTIDDPEQPAALLSTLLDRRAQA